MNRPISHIPDLKKPGFGNFVFPRPVLEVLHNKLSAFFAPIILRILAKLLITAPVEEKIFDLYIFSG
jgi:hypothetical protein